MRIPILMIVLFLAAAATASAAQVVYDGSR